MVGEVRLAHHTACLAPHCSVEHRNHALMTPGPKGVEPDPIEAEGMLFFKGFLLLLMSIATRVSGDDVWRAPWTMANVGDTTKEWTLAKVAAHLQQQWKERACGLH